MESALLIIHAILAIILIIVVLIQRAEGGALGIGVSQDNFMFSRSAGNFMTKATSIIAALFIICSLALTILSRENVTPSNSVIDQIEENNEKTIYRCDYVYVFFNIKRICRWTRNKNGNHFRIYWSN